MISNTDLFEFDKQQSTDFLVGTDEAGRGPAAGGVFAAAVHFTDLSVQKELVKLNDSKKLSKKVREELFDIILNNTINSIVCVEVDEIEKINILNSSLKAMNIACSSVITQSKEAHSPLVLVDGNKLIKEFSYSQKYVVKGDSKSSSIAAASILAKVSRDRYMEKLSLEYPEYLWHKNAGYLTKEHIEAIKKYGATKYHRLSFLKNILSTEKTVQLSII